MNIKELIQEANKAKFHPSQDLFTSAAKDFVHHSPPKSKEKSKNKDSGRHKRHQLRKAAGVKAGFGKSWSGEKVTFRVEMSMLDIDTDDQHNEQVHWIECKKFQGEQYDSYRKYFSRIDQWRKEETVESKFVNRYVYNWLILNREKENLNQAFIFPSTEKRDDKIRELLYRVIWTAESSDHKVDDDLLIVLKNSIWHSSVQVEK